MDKALLFGETALALAPGSPGAGPIGANELVDLAPAGEEEGVLGRLSKRLGEFLNASGETSDAAAADPSREQIMALLAEVRDLERRLDRLENAVRALGRQRQGRSMP